MSDQYATVPKPKSYRIMAVFGGIVLVGVGIYFAYMAANNLGLEDQEGTAIIIDKDYREAGRTYRRQIIGGRTHAVPHTTPEMYILKLDVGGREAECAVTKDLYDNLNIQDQIRVIYQRRRMSGTLQIVNIIE